MSTGPGETGDVSADTNPIGEEFPKGDDVNDGVHILHDDIEFVLSAEDDETGSEQNEEVDHSVKIDDANDATEAWKKLPEAVAANLRTIFGELTVQKKSEGATRRLDQKDAKLLVEAANILLEHAPDLRLLKHETDVTAAMIWKAAKRHNISPLPKGYSDAYAALSEELNTIAQEGLPSRAPREVKQRIAAYRKLLRMQRFQELYQNLGERLGKHPASIANWEDLFKGLTVKDLVPDLFPKIEEPVKRSVIRTDAGDRAEAAVPTPKETRDPPASPVHSELVPQSDGAVASLAEQNRKLTDALLTMDPNDQRLPAVRSLIDQNKALLGALGIEVPSTQVAHYREARIVQDKSSMEIKRPGIIIRSPGGQEVIVDPDQQGMIMMFGPQTVIQGPGNSES